MIPTGNRNFWIAQLIGWGLMASSNLSVQLIAGFPWRLLLYNSITPLIVGFLVTSAYRHLIRKSNWRDWTLGKVVLMILGSTILLTGSFLVILYSVFIFLFQKENVSLQEVLSNTMVFLLIMLIWNLLYFCIHYFNNWNLAEIEKWKLASEIKDAQLGSLKSQINPHFVFNTLNNIRSLILEDGDKARDMLLNFSDLFRYALKNTDQSKVTLKEELRIVNQYLELLSIQYEDKLTYGIDVTPDLEHMELPPMMLQLLVENAVKHGISQFKNGGVILINVERGDGFLNVQVKNTGSLKISSQLGDKLGVGLENIRKRLELIYNGKANLKIREAGDQVIAAIKIPLT